jgi:hypothetical protein
MKRVIVGWISLMILMLPSRPAWAWAHANRYGGSTWHAYGATAHTNAFGGGTAHVYGEGTTHANVYGGSTSHNYYGGTSHTNAYGATTYGGYDHYYGGTFGAYHPPVAVNSYASGCYNCGGWAAAAGAAAGVAIGAAAASAQNSAEAAQAYSAGYAAGAIYATLPGGCSSTMVQAETYYVCGNTWFSPFFGANGVSYRVVPAP